MFAFDFIDKNTLGIAIFVAALAWPSVSQSGDFEAVSPDETSLEIVGGEVRARLSHNGCTAGFETACSPILQRSEYVSTSSQAHGDRIVYSWEILVPEDFAYNASGGYLRATRFLNRNGESLLSFILDGENGYNISRKTCFGPESFGMWHQIEVRVAWDSTKKNGFRDQTPGELSVLCDENEVLSRSGRPNIGAEDEVWIALGLAGSLVLADGDRAAVSIRNISVETW